MSRGGSTLAGILRVVLTADTSKLSSGLNKAKTEVAGFSKGVAGAAGGLVAAAKASAGLVAGIAALVGTVATGGVFALAREFDDIGEQSRRLGLSVDTFERLKFAASQSGVEVGSLVALIERMASILEDVKLDSGLADTLRGIGVDPNRLSSLTPDNQLLTLMEALNGVSDSGARIAAAREIFGRGGGGVLQLGSVDEFRKLMSEAPAISQATADSMDRLTDSLDATVAGAKAAAAELFVMSGAAEAISHALETVSLVIRTARFQLDTLLKEPVPFLKSAAKGLGFRNPALELSPDEFARFGIAFAGSATPGGLKPAAPSGATDDLRAIRENIESARLERVPQLMEARGFGR